MVATGATGAKMSKQNNWPSLKNESPDFEVYNGKVSIGGELLYAIWAITFEHAFGSMFILASHDPAPYTHRRDLCAL